MMTKSSAQMRFNRSF
ncbi:hypothetical protein D046_1998B, partial [Vibrio parahaemolyticus V-223/04]